MSVLLSSLLLLRLVMALPLPFVWLAAAGLIAGYLIGPQLAFSPFGIGSGERPSSSSRSARVC
ncbi:hypothetical protein [Marisediminicola antarctica]|uniref:Uncharacterized protein n=1 Tax=Marisediminicola antarctica TaxID=674079 RepID=A0A7L5AJ39_9MICO|nr:hypothetical protein [Marisediminicola antarctica]QHO70618.1 hypothetical protein BHD05_14130 [Marisediminicola antarctica]